jgi:hypothetical protein
VDVQALPSGAAKPVQLDPVKIEYAKDTQYVVDPAKAHMLNFRCTKQSSIAELRDATTGRVLYTLSGTQCPYDFRIHQIPAEGRDIVVAEDSVHHLLAIYNDAQGIGVSIWQLSGDSYVPIRRLNTQGFTLEFTDHNERLRARNFNGWKIYTVADVLAYVRH